MTVVSLMQYIKDKAQSSERLSRSRIAKTIGDLEVGESAYTVHWVVAVNADGFGAINDSFTCGAYTPGRTFSMLVEKTSTGYRVTPDNEYAWRARDIIRGAPVEWVAR